MKKMKAKKTNKNISEKDKKIFLSFNITYKQKKKLEKFCRDKDISLTDWARGQIDKI